MGDLILELSKLIAENLQSEPNATVEALVERLKADNRIIQNILAFQTLVEDGGIANVGLHLHDFDEDKLEKVLKTFWKSLQPTGVPNNVPRSGVAKFIGRESELERVHTQLQQGNLVYISAVEGMGGVGKTELAIQYSQQYASSYEGGICWLFARKFNVGTQVVGFAKSLLNLKIPEGLELPDQVSFCWRNWREGDVLLVLDDVVNYRRDVESYLPPAAFSRFKVLMTTRLKFGPPIQSLSLDVLSPEQSLELLTVLIGEERVQRELDIAKTLCQWLEYLSLGIELVGRYLLKRTDLSLSTLLFRLQEKANQRKAIRHAALQQDELSSTTSQRGAEAAFEVSWEELDGNSQHLAKLLSLFARAPIPWKLAESVEKKYRENSGEEFDAEAMEIARARLLNLHLLQIVEKEKEVYRLHLLVREFFRSKLEGEYEADKSAHNNELQKAFDNTDFNFRRQKNLYYNVIIKVLPEILSIGEESEAFIYLSPINDSSPYIFEVLQDEAIGGELNILLNASGFQLQGDNTASVPLDPDTAQEIQIARFRLTPLRSGSATITAELYRGDTFETTLKAKVQVAGFDEASFTRTRITTQPRPVPQPDFILRVQTTWNETNLTCRFQYQLRSFRFPSLFPGETNYHSELLSSNWIEQMRGLLGTTLENISEALPEDGRSHLTSLGQYLFQHLLPLELQTDFRSLIPRDRTFTLLILADQDASLPWELLHDGQQFLSDRFIIGRWFWELNDTRPHEFPVGAINVAHYADVEQPELWTALLEPPGTSPPLLLPDSVLSNLDSTEAMRGLHLIRYSQSSDAANRRNAPVTLDDTNNAQDIEGQMRPAKLNLRRNRPLVSLGYVRRDRTELTTLEQTWASAFIRAGCSAFTGSLWAVDPAVEAAFISGFYNRLWTGDSLGEAFHASRQLARAVAPDSLDWLAYVLFGDPMARPYRPVEGKGYAVVEPIGREIDDPLPPGVPVRFRLSLRRTPPVWHEERVIEVAENLTFENLQAHVKTFGLQVTPDSAIAMTLAPNGNYLGWFTLVAPPEMAGNSALVQVFLMDGMQPIHSLMFSLNIENEGS